MTDIEIANSVQIRPITEIADKLGITYQSYQAYERGIAVPNLKNFIRLAEIYDVSMDFLIGKKDI